MRDDGFLRICNLTNAAAAGEMPREQLQTVARVFCESRTVGINRFYASLGVNSQADLVVRIWRIPGINAGMYADMTFSDHDGQYRILQVQDLTDSDGLKVTDLTLERMDSLYDVIDG